ncbi:DEHA2B00836p [Debaryomyces hansenii CBS767]|jgi:hypothetical protein|uniref:DEHA2B00836p n=1 Tax=Debaryomyces hansenii (strain ATCC 36239 / CBS 767 / BCRC 21394 / JCM 1990 / NBRC 0083 / IGC 2968) TaxID=284592 RepID=Q6BXR5_DEBHA|nr:DEHA2B00836p [Debaryomyces hansenii CBS767]CAG84989.1 DEHA2B00836p [Debaryomyces hansenii CBS767]|eukprot:XP_457004.1 DEHA2B00836p [Debaryomyces hansenii CBS767]
MIFKREGLDSVNAALQKFKENKTCDKMMIFRASEHNKDSYLSYRIVFDKMP